jgi:ACS family pantothenate transporter-like MFS transporter
LTEEEKDTAIRRLGAAQKQTWDLTVFKRVLLSWQFWLLPSIFMLYSLSIQAVGNNVVPLWMKSQGYTVAQQNNYPTAIFATAIVGTIFYAALSDKIQSRWQPSIAIGLTYVIGSAILVAIPVHNIAGHFFAFYLLGMGYAPQALWYSWMADVTAHDVQLRAITTGFMNCWDFVFVTWWPLIFFPVTIAPDYRKGFIARLVTGALVIPMVLLIAYLEKTDRARGKIGRKFEENEVAPTGDAAQEEVGRIRVPIDHFGKEFVP